MSTNRDPANAVLILSTYEEDGNEGAGGVGCRGQEIDRPTLWQASLGVLIDDASLNWLILPEAVQTGDEAENEARVAGERVTLPDRGKKQERRKPAG